MPRSRRTRPPILTATLVGSITLGLVVAVVVLALPGSVVQQRLASHVVKRGVYLEGVEVAGMSPTELQVLIANMAAGMNRAAEDAQVDRETASIVPGLSGLAVDVEASVAATLAAPAGSMVSLVTREVPPRKSLMDFPTYPVRRGHPSRREIALAINVAWGTEHLPAILRTLAEHNARATFFLVGTWAAENPDVVRELAAAGHDLGNHSYSHPHVAQLSDAALAEEISRATDLIEKLSGKHVGYFSPPYGEFDERIIKVAHNQGYPTVLWSIDTVDWKHPPVTEMIKGVLDGAHNGAIVLMHPTPEVARGLPEMVAGLQALGYRLVTVSELLSTSP